MATPPPVFRIEETALPEGRVRLKLVGELDLASKDALAEALAAHARSKHAVVLDLGELEFIDSSGMHVLLSAAADARRDGWSLSLMPPSDGVGRALAVARVLDLLPFEKS